MPWNTLFKLFKGNILLCLRKSPAPKYRANQPYHDQFAPQLGQIGPTIKTLKNFNITKLKKMSTLA